MTAGNTCGFNDACSSYNSMDIYIQQLGKVPVEGKNPR